MAEIRLSVMEVDGYLPPVCMCCGQPATANYGKKMSWYPPWVAIAIVLGLLPYLILVSIMTRRAVVQGPFCEIHKGHWFNRSVLMWGSFVLFTVLGLGSVIFSANLPGPHRDDVLPYAGIGCLVLFVVWIVIAMSAYYSGIRAKEITDEEIVLAGLSDTFVEAVEEAQREREERRAARRRERARDRGYDDDYDDRRRRPI